MQSVDISLVSLQKAIKTTKTQTDEEQQKKKKKNSPVAGDFRRRDAQVTSM